MGTGPRVVAFVLNAQINSVRTPDMLNLWGYLPTAACKLCDAKQCSLHHVLVGCKLSLNQGRYQWRHDSVLSHIEQALEELLSLFNDREPIDGAALARVSYDACFVRKGEKKKGGSVSKQTLYSKLSSANDWQMLVDYEDRLMVFPPFILSTTLRPDIVMWSKRTSQVVLMELTICAEEGIVPSWERKRGMPNWSPTLTLRCAGVLRFSRLKSIPVV